MKSKGVTDMRQAVITDYNFADVELERNLLAPLGCRLEALKSSSNRDELVSLVKHADFVITQFADLNAEVIGQMERCKLIVRYGIGVDNVDVKAAALKGIPVCNVPDYCTNEVADHALALILDLCRRVTENAVKVRGGTWGSAVPLQAMRSLKDQTVGIVAYGRIGREVALRLRAFKCELVAFDPFADEAKMRADGVEPVSLEQLYSRSTIITLHCPSTEETRFMINAESIARMRVGTLLVNVSRGTLVQTDDLARALASGHLAAAAVDVTDPEPIDPAHPLVGLGNALITPHVAAWSPQAVLRLRHAVAETVAIALRGEKLPNVVNGGALGKVS
ncbi:MAG: C-terminal binding protein [Spirochaetales bacterium]